MQAAKDPNRPELDDAGNRRPATVARRSALRTAIWTLAAAAGVIGAVSFQFAAAPGDAFKRLLSREEIKPGAGKPAQPQTRSAATPSIPAEREVTFPGNRREQGERPQLRATLYMPAASRGRPAAVVILPSSAGVRDEREIYYAEALRDAGIAALVVDSYRSRNLRHSLRGQSLLGSWEISNDAMFRFRTWRTDLIG